MGNGLANDEHGFSRGLKEIVDVQWWGYWDDDADRETDEEKKAILNRAYKEQGVATQGTLH